jgi:hypothetical protein
MSNFDLGKHGFAYWDANYANYGASTGSFSFWNQGWRYRNDAVDIEKTEIPGGNGFNVGFIEKGEWLNYSLTVDQAGVYDIALQFASPQAGAQFHLSIDGVDVTPVISLGSTGGWTDYELFQISEVILPAGQHTITFHIDGTASANFSRMDFIFKSASVDLPFELLTAKTEKTEQSIKMTLNYPVDPTTVGTTENDFSVTIDNVTVSPEAIQFAENSPYTLELLLDTAGDVDAAFARFAVECFSGICIHHPS